MHKDDTMNEEYQMVEAADACPVQEDVEWQDLMERARADLAVPEDLSLGHPLADMCNQYGREIRKWEEKIRLTNEYASRLEAYAMNRIKALRYCKEQEVRNATTQLIAQQGGKRKSFDTPCARFGFRKHPEKLKVNDAQAVVEAVANGKLPQDCIKLNQEVVVAKSELDKLYQQTGEIPPGCIIEPEKEEFYVTPR